MSGCNSWVFHSKSGFLETKNGVPEYWYWRANHAFRPWNELFLGQGISELEGASRWFTPRYAALGTVGWWSKKLGTFSREWSPWKRHIEITVVRTVFPDQNAVLRNERSTFDIWYRNTCPVLLTLKPGCLWIWLQNIGARTAPLCPWNFCMEIVTSGLQWEVPPK